MTIRIAESFYRKLDEWSDGGDFVSSLLVSRDATESHTADYLALRDDGTISFLPSSKASDEAHESPWVRRHRQNARPGRVVKMVLKLSRYEELVSYDIERFTYLCQSANEETHHVDIVSGDDIGWWYNQECVHECQSCMHGKSSILKLYTENPEKVSLAIVSHNGVLQGRALIWEADDGKRYMDRIYGTGSASLALRSYREDQDIGDVYVHDAHDIYVSLPQADMTRFPYMDSLRYFYPGKGVSNALSGERWGKSRYILDSTDGGHDIAYHGSCPMCGYPSNGEGEFCESCVANNTCTGCGIVESQQFNQYNARSPFQAFEGFCSLCIVGRCYACLNNTEDHESNLCPECRTRFTCSLCHTTSPFVSTVRVNGDERFICQHCVRDSLESGQLIACMTCCDLGTRDRMYRFRGYSSGICGACERRRVMEMILRVAQRAMGR